MISDGRIMKRIVIVLLLSCAVSSLSSTVEDWESQKNYDENLFVVLRQLKSTIGAESLPDFRACMAHHKLGGEIIPVSNIPKVYKYYLIDATSQGIRIKAENKFGGRSYIYDYEWNVVHYMFHTPEEARVIGEVLIDWVTSDNHPIPPEEKGWAWIPKALGYRGCFTDMMYYDDARFDILGCFGDFLVFDDLREQIWKIVMGGRIFTDEHCRISVLREKVVRSILSKYDSYPIELQKEVLIKVAKYLETVDDKETNYSKQIAEFVLSKGGAIPDRRYWDYDTSWIPFHGGIKFREGLEKKAATLEPMLPSTNSPLGGAEGSVSSEH